MGYFIPLLFVPAVVLAIAAMVADEPKTKGNFLKSALAFFCLAGLVIPIIVPVQFWKYVINWFHHSN